MRHFLNKRLYATIATDNSDGTIHLTPLYYLFENGQFYMACWPTAQKAKNIRVQPKATVIIDSRKMGHQQWVSATGLVEIIEGNTATDINTRIFQRYYTSKTFDNAKLNAVLTSLAKNDVTLHLMPERWQSWDIREADEAHTGGLMTTEPERWFLPLDE